MKHTLVRKVCQVLYLLLFLISASASWFLKDVSNNKLSTAAAIVFSLLMLQSMKTANRV